MIPYGGYEPHWEIRGTTSLTGLRRPHIGDSMCPIGACTSCSGDGKMSRTWNSLKSQFLTMISPISSHFSLSCPQLYHHLRTHSWVIPRYFSMPWSWVNTEYSVHQLLHHPMVNILPLPASVSSLGGCTQLSTFPPLRIHKWIVSAPIEHPSPSTASRYFSNVDWSWPPSVSPNTLNYGFQVHRWVHSISASKCIANPARSWPQGASLSSLDLGLQMHLHSRKIAHSKCISQCTRSRSPKPSPNSLDPGLWVHLWVHSILVCKCISKHARSRPPSTSLRSDSKCMEIQG